MRFYAACLAAYNNGFLHGRWIDASSDIDEMQEAVTEMLTMSPVNGVEEWAIHDAEGLPSSIGEYSGLAPIAAFVELVDEFDHIDADDLMTLVADYRDIDAAGAALRESFIGTYDSFRDYADAHADEIILAECASETARQYFDYASFARDLRMDMHVIDTPSGVAVFYA